MSEEKDEKDSEALVEKQADLNVSQIADPAALISRPLPATSGCSVGSGW